MRNLLVAIATIGFTAFCLQGCSEQKHDPRAEDGPQRPQPSIEATEDAFKKRSMDFPADFPLPNYPGSEVELAQLKLSKEPVHQVILKTSDPAEMVFRFYIRALKEGGWDIGKVAKKRGYMVLRASKNGSDATIMITETRTGITAISLFANKR